VLTVSCAFPPVSKTPAHIALAESLGYANAWCYDTPALQLDVWMTLARAADRTTRIGLGPAVIIPSLRHVVTTAAAIATLFDLAPGRTNVAVGAGFTGRLALGQRPLPLRAVRDYVIALRALLRGEAVEVDGALVQLLHGPGQAPAFPIDVPMLLAIGGPKSEALASEMFDGVFTVVPHSGFEWSALMAQGTVLDEGETYDSPRVIEAGGPGAAILLHAGYAGTVAGVENLPGAAEWRTEIEKVPAEERHLRTHVGHLTYLNDTDRKVMTGALIQAVTFSGSTTELRARFDGLARAGVTELVYQPAGPDIERELVSFATMAGLEYSPLRR
jgi:5,10-methylenetetrahydromethanopterin reductase